MKKIYKSVLVVLAAATLTSCGNSWLDESPSNGADTEVAIDNYAKALNALYGVYDGLQGSSSRNEYYGARMLYYGDVRADDMQSSTGTRTVPLYEMRYTASNAPGIWEIPYNVIRRANSLLDAIEKGKVADGKEADLADMKGQCLTVRALAHFDLCRIYGKPYQMDNGASYGVPIITKPVNPYDGEGLYPSRNSVKEVYDQVISDLTAAIPLLKTAQTKENGYINQGAAKALLSRVYLYKGDNQQALSVAKEVIASGSYELWATDEYVSGWSKPGSKEMIFEIVNKGTDDWVDRESIGYLMAEDGYSDMVLTKKFVDELNSDPNDIRIGVTLAAVKAANIKLYGTNRVYLNKFPGKTGDVRVNNIPALRISEIYLNAAEAAFKLGDNATAVEYLNPIVLRANPKATPVAAGDVTLERILLERAKELVGEGHRFFDAMRNNQTVVRYTSAADQGWQLNLTEASRKFDNTYFRTILPIPVKEIDSNYVIAEQQNPGY